MAHITGEDRSQLLLLPDTVDDYVGPDNPVRFIDAFVDGLDLEAAGFQRVRPNDKGRPHPSFTACGGLWRLLQQLAMGMSIRSLSAVNCLLS